MKRHKRILLSSLAAFAAALLGASFAACSKDEQIKYTFVLYGGETVTVTGKAGEKVEFPDTSKEGYIFKGWYLTEDYSGESFSEATFSADTTYYSKWAQGYAITLDLDGGSLENTGVFYLEEGASISEFMQSYTPTKGEYQFGGWYTGEDELSSSDTMTTSGITLTAKYKAEYTLNVYLQNEDLSSYAAPYVYESGYALIDEDFTTDIAVSNYALNAEKSDETTVLISGNKSENVFSYYFDRQFYTLVYHANNPDGSTSEIKQEQHMSGSSFVLAENSFEVGDYRFLGWATSASGNYADVIKTESYSITADTILYAIWDQGYVDMFGGKDKIYINYADNTAVLVRGGISIDGVYDEIIECYTFTGTNPDVVLTAKVNDDGTFLYYSNRIGVYTLYTMGVGLNSEIKITLDEGNGCTYTDSASKVQKSGTYKINSDGIYTATLTDAVTGEETTIQFIVDTVSSQKVFMIRGAEADYGTLPYQGIYYPTLTFNGYGYALYATKTNSSYYYYIANGDDKFTLYDTSGKAAGAVILDNFEQEGAVHFGFEFYLSAFDATFTNGDATLTMDGRSTAVYEKGNTKLTGTFSYTASLFGGYIVTVTVGDDNYLYLVSISDGTFTEKEEGYAEYRFVTDAGKVTFPYLTINGDGTATFYEKDAAGEISLISTGTIEKAADESYLYKVTGTVADWATMKATSMVFMLDTTSTNYDVFYLLSSSEGEDNTTDYTTVYTATDGSNLKLTKYFAIYSKADGTVFSGFISQNTGYISVSDGTTTNYFSIKGETFEQLTQAPLVLIMRKDGTANSNCVLSIDGTTIPGEEEKYTAVYMETIDGVTTSYEGYYYLSATVSGFGSSASVYTFVATDKTFKFTVSYTSSSSAVTYYFNYYETNDVIEFLSVADSYNEKASFTLTDKLDGNNFVFLYKLDDTVTEGTVVSKDITAFDKYEVTIYTFTSLDGATKIKFSLRKGNSSSYFVESVADATYTSFDGSTLTVNGEANIARYTTADGTEYDNYSYFDTDSPEGYDLSIFLYIDNVIRYFDIDSANDIFELRGIEAASYLTVKNGVIDGTVITLDGHGLATVTIDETSASGTYTLNGDVYTVSLTDGKTYIGKLGTMSYSGSKYNAFYILVETIVGSYLNESDLSVLVLDSTGGATRYDLYGEAESGRYMIIKEGLFYYASDDGDTSFVYAYTYEDGVGKVAYVGFDKTYYASDFSSIVFTEEGYASFNYKTTYYYSYDKDSRKISLYSFDPENENANQYGFVTEEFTITGDSIDYTDLNTSVSRTYKEFDGHYVEFTDAEGNTLEFQPTGAAIFSVPATYTTKDGTTTSYTFVVNYQDYEVISYLAYTGMIYPNGSVLGYNDTYTLDISLDFADKTFVFDSSDYTYGITFYDYYYLYLYFYYGASYSSLFGGYYGALQLVGNDSGDKTSYTLSGGFNYLKDSEGNAVTFTDGTLSTAGYYNSNYGNLFLCEFTGSDGNTYHLSFFMNQYNGYFSYLVYSLTLVTDTLDLGDGTLIYSEQLVYTIFNLTKSTDEATGEATYYEVGDEYLPSLRYKGELICAFVGEGNEENTLVFESYQYAKSSYKTYYYYFLYTVDEEGSINGGTVSKYETTKIETANGNYVYALADTENGTVKEIYVITIGGVEYDVTSCVANEDGTFTVVIETGSYTVGFTTNDDGTQTATITKIEAA